MAATPKTDDLYFLAMKTMFWIVFVGLLAFATVFAWPVIRGVLDVLTPFIFGIGLAYVFHPLVQFVQFKLRLGRLGGMFVVGFCLILIFGGFFAVLIPILIGQVSALIDGVSNYLRDDFPELLNRMFPPSEERDNLVKMAVDQFDTFKNEFENWRDPEKIGEILKDQGESIRNVASGSVGAMRQTLSALFSVFGWIGGIGATLMLGTIVAFYCLIEMSKTPAIVRRMIPGEKPERLWNVLLKANATVGGFLRGQLIACTGVGMLASIILFAIGLKKYAILIGFTAGAVNFIPYLGPTVGATPAILWAMFATDLPGWADDLTWPMWGVRLLLIGLVVGGFAVVQMVDGLIFQPFIVGKSAALHPLNVMFALVLGAQFGVGGMILAVPVACVVKVFFIEYYWSNTSDFMSRAPKPEEPPTEDPADSGGAE